MCRFASPPFWPAGRRPRRPSSPAALLLYLLARRMMRGGWQAQEDERAAPAPFEPEAPAAVRLPVETDVGRLMALALELAGRHDYQHGLDFLYAALLRRLEGE